MSHGDELKLETLAARSGPPMDERTGAVAPGIELSTTFGRDRESRLVGDFFYTRYSNANQADLERAMAKLEGGAAARVFASGMAAATALLQSLEAGSHVLVAGDCYFGVRAASTHFGRRWGLDVELIDMTDAAVLESHLRDSTALVLAETPSNPGMRMTDIERTAALVHRSGAQLVVDNTFATPILQRPLDHGADIVLHSASKYFGGHSDVLGGGLVFAEEGAMLDAATQTQIELGASLAPFNSWLILRGLKTLACRVRA